MVYNQLHGVCQETVRGPSGSGFLGGVVQVAASSFHSLAVKGDGTVWGWGHNLRGQLGDGTSTERHYPVQTKGPGGAGTTLGGITALATTSDHVVALKSDGTVWTWGHGPNGELGTGAPAPPPISRSRS